MIWRTVSHLVDEAIPLDHPRRFASWVIRWYGLIHSTWYSTPDQVTIIIMCICYSHIGKFIQTCLMENSYILAGLCSSTDWFEFYLVVNPNDRFSHITAHIIGLLHYHLIYTHYHNSNLIWRTVSHRVDEVISSDHPRVWPIHETWCCTQDQVTIMIIFLLYTFFWHYSGFITCFGLYSRKNAGTFAITLRFLLSRHHVFRLWFHAWKFT